MRSLLALAGMDTESPTGVSVVGSVHMDVVATAERLPAAGESVVGHRMALSPGGTFLFVANGPSNDVSVVDVAARKEIARVKAGEGPWGLAIVRRQ